MKPNKKEVTVLELWKLPPFYFTIGSVVGPSAADTSEATKLPGKL